MASDTCYAPGLPGLALFCVWTISDSRLTMYQQCEGSTTSMVKADSTAGFTVNPSFGLVHTHLLT